ncbi:RelA/SpoT family protein [Kallotenue papyrolyticum]|uniref:RelA/SpoT family protein n=1 Tax=Kallotenue papyrolyticum TaxID=1325125 RepID=UPI0004786580|nr:bifunctional (p)ppGpp synthetase/guanosine-3',5'-bis(diphosphate) 3'-pyrophosphohydrolase [Kallotenue papyrolyticum]
MERPPATSAISSDTTTLAPAASATGTDGVPGVPGEPQRLIERLRVCYPDLDEQVVRTAYAIACQAHRDQRRKSGEPYIQHPVAVAHILIDLKLDPACIAAGLLHDVVEDSEVTLDQIRERCGPEIAAIVDGLTKLKVIEGRTKEDAQIGSYRKMFIAMADDPRVVLIKLADRLHNMRTLQHTPPEQQQRVARETLEIYAPLAHRLGIWQIKWELEDLAFRFLNPEMYHTISRQLQLRRDARERIIQRMITRLRAELEKEGIRAEITGRPKHIYSIWRKMERKGVPLDQIYDQLAVRVIVNTVDECYRVLGVVHNRWTPIPSEFDDYIAMPKESMYQSLHTTVLLPGGQPCEIQIRTHEMHEVAEHGIAAHWRYKEGLGRKTEASFEAKLQWLRNLIAWRREVGDERDSDFVETLKSEMLEEQVYVFTPKGKIIDLPEGSTPVDFAYRIHSDIGNNCIGARVNNRQVPLHYQLQNGDIVQIITSKQPRGPSRDWLDFVKTSNARNHIRRWFRRQERDLNIAAGRELLERELKRLSINVSFDEIAEANNFKAVEDLFLAIGVGDHHPREIVKKVLARQKSSQEAGDLLARLPEVAPRQPEPSVIGVQVRGGNGIHTRLARCCNPVEGDPIIGFVTRGKGLTIHRADCRNINYERDRERLMEVSWGPTHAKQAYPVPIRIEAWDRVGLWRDITNAVADMGINIQSVHQVENRHANRATLVATLMVDSLLQLTTILDKINRIPDVIEAHRIRAASA